tara:strand:+ start:434 stop:1033 length:600 start_codon:yes stop_codon:yes gene_type:complete
MGSGIGYIGGNYKNDQPGQAAKKAGKALFKKLALRKFAKYKNKTSIKFVLRMRDRHSAGKTYSYMVTREKLPKPLLMKKANVEYEIKYKYNIESCDLTSAEVKTMTGGALAIVGGKLSYTGKKISGGNAENEEFKEEEKEEKEEEEEVEDEDEEFEGGDKTEDADSSTEELRGGRSKTKKKATRAKSPAKTKKATKAKK